MTSNIKEMLPEEFRIWILPIIGGTLFESRERLMKLLTDDADRTAIETEFREYFEGYCGLAFSLEEHEEVLLSILDTSDMFAPLRHRVAVVKSERKTSELGRELRRMGTRLYTDPAPAIKVAALSDTDFRHLMETFVNWPIFAAQARVTKLLEEGPSVAKPSQLKAAFLEFFVCYLELEQFLEDYDYDGDDDLVLRPEVEEELDRSIAEVEAGTAELIPLEEVAKEFGVKLKCTR